MHPLLRTADQDITYWEPASRPDATDGDFYRARAWSAPAALKGHWSSRRKRMVDDDGDEFTSMARVYLDRSVRVGGFLYLGASSAADPKSVEGAYEIRMAASTPDARNLYRLHSATLGGRGL